MTSAEQLARFRAIRPIVLEALAAADPIGTGLTTDRLRDEYGMEADDIARRLAEGADARTTVREVFADTTGMKLPRATLKTITEQIEQASRDQPDQSGQETPEGPK